MSKMKAVVFEKSGSRYTVLGENGLFLNVHRRLNAEVGEEIEISTGLAGFGRMRLWAGFAAVFLLVFTTTLLAWNFYKAPTAVALLSIDINPTLQVSLDPQGHLLKLQTENDDARQILKQVDLTGKPINEVLGQIVTRAFNQKYLNPQQNWIVVGYSPLNDMTAKQIPSDLTERQIKTWIAETGKKIGFIPQVAVFALNSQDVESAQKENLTLGEYALWQAAQNAGITTQPQELKEPSERVKLLDNSKVQAQIDVEKKNSENQNQLFPLNNNPSVLPQNGGGQQKGTSQQNDQQNDQKQDPVKPKQQTKGQAKQQAKAQVREQDKEKGQDQEQKQDSSGSAEKDTQNLNKEKDRTKNKDTPNPTPNLNSKSDSVPQILLNLNQGSIGDESTAKAVTGEKKADNKGSSNENKGTSNEHGGKK